MISNLSQFDFHHRLATRPGPALIAFTGPNCGSCRHLHGVLETVAAMRPEWAVFEVDAERDPALAHEFEVFHLPTLVLYNDGGFHCFLQAQATPESIENAVFQSLEKKPEEAP